MRVHRDWGTDGFKLEPIAPLVGPFVGRAFLETWWRHRGEGEPILAETDGALLAAHRGLGGVRLMGEADLIDYHSPLGAGVAGLLVDLVAFLPKGTPLSFDSLPGEAAQVVSQGLEQAGVAASVTPHEVAAVLDLSASYDEYLASLDKKERHEIRRKGRRFESVRGAPHLIDDTSLSGLAVFVAMHRTAPGEKGRFMTGEMEAFFADLLLVPGARLDFLVDGEGAAVAAGFGFQDERAYYLYNSAFDPGAGEASPGAVLLDRLIRRAIGERLSRFDLLKGDEAYKFRIGAQRRRLYLVEAST